jgi:hypothetical protein
MFERVAELLSVALRQQACEADGGSLGKLEPVETAGRLAAQYANKVQTDIDSR